MPPPSYPYPPSPYPPEVWSLSQDQNYKTNYQLPPTRPLVDSITYSGHTSSENIHSEVLMGLTSFEAWESFDERVQTAKQDIRAHCAGLSEVQLASLMQRFGIAHEDLTTSRNINSEAHVSNLVHISFSNTAKLHQHIDGRNTILDIAHRARLPSALFRFGGSPILDFCFLREEISPNQVQARHRLVAVEIKKVDFPITATSVPHNDPNYVATSHNQNFRLGKPVWYLRMMSQILTYALHTKCGCAIVTTHNQAMFMQVIPIRDNNTGRWTLNVKVSKLYRCNERTSSFLAVLAILRKSYEEEDLSSQLGQAFSQVQAGRILPSTRSRSTHRRRQGTQAEAGLSAHTRSQTGQVDSRRRNRTNHDTAPSQQDDAETGTVLDRFYRPELIAQLMEKSDDIIAHEGHSTVLRSRYGKRDVAVKYWNHETSTGLKMLSNELKVYEEVVSKYAHLLGTVLPQLIALWKEPKIDTVIVTEYVGETLARRDDGSADPVLLIGGNELDSNDYRLLRQAAFDALEKMHSTGLRHRDLDERNIRARREKGRNGEVEWKVWFIDLGMASFSGDSNDAETDKSCLTAATRGPPNGAV